MNISKIEHSSFGKNQIRIVYMMTTQNRKTKKKLEENTVES
jgi:hypothetical protein